MKKRIMMLMAVSALMVAMLMVSAVPAFAQTTENPFDAAQLQALLNNMNGVAQQQQISLQNEVARGQNAFKVANALAQKQNAFVNIPFLNNLVAQQQAAANEKAAGVQDLANLEAHAFQQLDAGLGLGGIRSITPPPQTGVGAGPGPGNQKLPVQ